MAATRSLGWLKWECERCHRDVVVENTIVEIVQLNFDVRCPLCDKLVRFVMPPVKDLDALPPGESMPITRSNAEPIEVH